MIWPFRNSLETDRFSGMHQCIPQKRHGGEPAAFQADHRDSDAKISTV